MKPLSPFKIDFCRYLIVCLMLISWFSTAAAAENNDPNITAFSKYFYINQGLVTLNPFSIHKVESENKYIIEDCDEKEFRYFLELGFRRRRAWHRVPTEADPNLLNTKEWLLDSEVRLGFTTNNQERTGSTIVGSSDVYVDSSLGLPWMLKGRTIHSDDREMTVTLNAPEFVLGITTDRDAQDIHDYEAIGAAFVAGFPTNTRDDFKNRRQAEVLIGVYASFLEVADYYVKEVTKMVDGNPVTEKITYVNETDSGYPDFETEEAIMVRASFRIPVGEKGFFSVEFRSYSGFEDFNPWSLFLGAAASPDILGELLEKFF